MFRPHELGRKGELLAAELLSAKGYTILEKNWRKGRIELDIIALDSDFLVICEVKTRSSEQFGDPDERINDRKTEAMASAAAAYQEEKNLDQEFRFDIISIVFNGEELLRIDHIPDAFHP